MKLFALSPIAPSCSPVCGLLQLAIASIASFERRWRESQFLRLIQEVLDGRRRPLTSAARGSFAHRLELGADRESVDLGDRPGKSVDETALYRRINRGAIRMYNIA